MATSVPFDEEEDAASVAKGLAMLHAHPELGPGEAFKGRAPVRSSLQTLRMPFEYAPLEDDEEEGATRSFRISEPKILEVHYQCFTFSWSTCQTWQLIIMSLPCPFYSLGWMLFDL